MLHSRDEKLKERIEGMRKEIPKNMVGLGNQLASIPVPVMARIEYNAALNDILKALN